MKILMSELACQPGNGVELEVGSAPCWPRRAHQLWVLTNKDTVPSVRRTLRGRPGAEGMHLEGIDFGMRKVARLLTIRGFHRYYDRWQRRPASPALELDRRLDFDVVHHATLALGDLS
jgi:hypothetical protein